MATPTGNEGDKTQSTNIVEAEAKKGEVDDELNDILDDAFADFGKEQTEEAGAADEKPPPKVKASDGGDPISDMFAEEFSDGMSKQFEEAMQSFLGEDPGMMEQIGKLAEAAEQSSDSPDAQKEFEDTLKHTLSSMAQNTEGLQDPEMSEEAMMNMLSGMSLGGDGAGAGAGEEGFMPMMQGMMKTLLSKDVLYPSLKEIADKYPAWLEENKSKVKEAEFSNYSQQYDIIAKILTEFEAEQSSDTDIAKKQRFDKIMDMMQKMQDLGQPPKEIVGDMAPGLEFDANGVPKFPGMSDGCHVM